MLLDVFKVLFTFYHGKLQLKAPFGRIVFTSSKHLKQIQVFQAQFY